MIKPFVVVTGVAAPLMRNNIDTDQIAPGKTVMKVDKAGFGSGLFYNWRYLSEGTPNPEFVLNSPSYNGACFLVAGTNFGCGSSREVAVWALRDFGIRAVIAPSFGAIFINNCYANGIIPIRLAETDVVRIASELEGKNKEITVNIETLEVASPSGGVYIFPLPNIQRERFLEGIDAIDATLKRKALIDAFQERDSCRRPWIYNI